MSQLSSKLVSLKSFNDSINGNTLQIPRGIVVEDHLCYYEIAIRTLQFIRERALTPLLFQLASLTESGEFCLYLLVGGLIFHTVITLE